MKNKKLAACSMGNRAGRRVPVQASTILLILLFFLCGLGSLRASQGHESSRVARISSETILLVSVDCVPLENIFAGIPVATETPHGEQKAAGGCMPGFYPEEGDYGCYGGDECPHTALCQFQYAIGCKPYYYPYTICHGCADDRICWPGW